MSIGGKVNYYFTGTLIILLILFVFFVKPARADTTQSNVTGSNTQIEGNYTSDSTTTYESGSESTSNTPSTRTKSLFQLINSWI